MAKKTLDENEGKRKENGENNETRTKNNNRKAIHLKLFEMGLVEQRLGEIIKIKPQSQTASDISLVNIQKKQTLTTLPQTFYFMTVVAISHIMTNTEISIP